VIRHVVDSGDVIAVHYDPREVKYTIFFIDERGDEVEVALGRTHATYLKLELEDIL
jgi:hypothetical protein